MLNKAQYLALLGAMVLFLALYLGFDTKPSAQQTVDQSRSILGQQTSFEVLEADAKAHLSDQQMVQLRELEQQLSVATDTARTTVLKQLSGWWYAQGQVAVAGGLAEQVAELENTDAAWSVTGATFYHALLGEQNPQLRDYCAAHAIKAFESAISLRPQEVEHQVNLALIYAEKPPADNPMKAVLMLRELETKYPEYPAVYNALGRLAIKTGQWEKAIQRLEKAWSLDPNNPNTPCLLAKAYDGAGQADKAAEFLKRCNSN